MRCLDLTCPSPAENLACDEALLDWCEETGSEVLRLSHPIPYFVVLGCANKYREETHFEACERDGVPVLRRCSGGGTVLQGKGSFNYALVLRIDRTPGGSLLAANQLVMERNREIVRRLADGDVDIRGHTDLTWNGRKFSGNAQRRKRTHFLFHGTFLIDFDFSRVERWLRMPGISPEYRQGRSHAEFLTNIPVDESILRRALRSGWEAEGFLEMPAGWSRLMEQRYGRKEWNLRY